MYEPEKTREEKLVDTVSNGLNTFCFSEKKFCEAMDREHRTLQQSFTRLCLAWIAHCAEDAYRTDGRNEYSKTICKKIVDKVGKDDFYVPMI